MGPRPRVETLEEWAHALGKIEISHAVSLIEDEEISAFDLEGEPDHLSKHKIGFTRFPIKDFGTPDPAVFSGLIDELVDSLIRGERLFLHCNGGIGRAGLTACCLLASFYCQQVDTFKIVSQARGKSCPETQEQMEFVSNFSK